MALTFNELIAAGSPLPRGTEASDPTPTQLETTPTRPLFGSTPLARLQAPTLGERLGELIIKTARAKYEQRYAQIEQELTLQYSTDQARLEAIATEEEALLKHLQGMDKELQELAVARARGGVDDSSQASMYNAITARGKALDDSRREWADLRKGERDRVLGEYALSNPQSALLQEVEAGLAGHNDSTIGDYLSAVAPRLRVLSAGGATPAQQQEFAAQLHSAALSLGISPEVAARAIGKVTGVSAAAVPRSAVNDDQELRIAQAEAGLRGGMRDPGATPERSAAKEKQEALENKATEVNTWAQSPEGRAVLAALGDDGQIDDTEAANLARLRNEAIEEATFDATTGRPGVRGQANPAQVRREVLEDAGRYAVLASTPGIGEMVSTDARRALDPRRLETLAALRALGEEEETVRAGMVAPTYRNIGSGVQAERLQAQAARQLSQGLRQDARQAGQAAAQTERERSIRQDGKPASPAQVAGARKQAKSGAQAALPGLDPNATPEMRRFAQAMAKSVAAGTWGDDQLPKQADDMFRLYQKGQLRDPGEAVRRAMELAPDDPDSVLVPYLQRVNKYQKDMDALPPGVDTSTYL